MRKIYWLLGSLLIFCGSILLSQCNSEKKTEDARLDLPQSKFLNLSSEAKYVGSEKCTSCHSSIHEDFIHTGKGRAFHKVDKANMIEDFSNVHVYDSYSGYHYTAFWRNDLMIVSEYRLKDSDTIYKREIAAQYVIGSGNQTRSYLFEENGYFFEIPITWYVKKKIWDLSPGYENGANTRFSRPISQMCMNCHNSGFEFVEHSVNRFLTVGNGIGCEKCHGPGSVHLQKVAEASYDPKEVDYSIVNPAHLSLELQFDVCRQCHLEGVTVPKEGKDFVDFRPGMPLNDFWEVYVPVGADAADFGFASHVERLQMSECFKSSEGKMNCTTCHDAHKPLSDNPLIFYNEKCQACHGVDACGEEHQTLAMAENNCITCHMPKDGTTDIPHVSTSDHFIRIHGDSIVRIEEGGLKEFRNFTTGETNNRDVFMANMEYYEKVEQDKGYLSRIEKFINEVERNQQIKYYYLKGEKAPPELLTGNPLKIDDPYTAFYIGELLRKNGQNGIIWLERASDLAPDNIEFSNRLAKAYLDEKNYTKSKLILLSIIDKNKFEVSALVNLGFIYQLENDFPSALELTRSALDIDPFYLRARENMVNIYLNLGDYTEAKTRLESLIEDYPDNQQYKSLQAKLDNPATM